MIYNVDIGIVETRKVIEVIKETYNYDYKNYALTFFKHRLERVIEINNLRDIELLIQKLKTDQEFFEKFIQDISVETTELFRDPSLWRLIRDDFLYKQTKIDGKYKIWVAGVQSGEELYSMAILIEESKLWDKVDITASYDSDFNLGLIRQGIFNLRKQEANDANYRRFNCFSELTKYYKVVNNTGYWDTSLIKNVKFLKLNVTFDNSPKNFNLVWFRNQMLYFNQILQDYILGVLYDSLVQGGYLVIGDKETVEYSTYNKKLKLINDTEKVYKKI